MTRPTSIQDWQSVDTLADFVTYLSLLAADARLAEQSSGKLVNTTIPAFLAAIDTLLARAQHQAARRNPALAEPMMTTWRELAALLHNARTEPPALADIPERQPDETSVESLEALRAYLRWLIEDFRLDAAEVAERTSRNKWDNEGRWAHRTLSNWLGTWAAWLADSYLKPLSAPLVKLGIEREPVEPMGWRSIAIQLSGARIYE